MADEADFASFVRASSRGLQRTAWLLTGDWHTAQDLAQTALAKSWPRWDSIHPAAAEAYVRRVMVTTYLAWRSRRWTGETPTLSLPEKASEADAFAHLDLRTSLLAVLARLPRRQRAVVVLRYFDDLSEAATAEVLGCSVGTVKSQASRALSALRSLPGLQAIVDERTAE